MIYSESTIRRFWTKVDRSAGPDACWPWLGNKRPTGYGSFFVKRIPPGSKGKAIYVNPHRLAYELTYAPIASGLHACHKCDNPSCCNPNHIFPGTPRENMQDAVAKGRVDYHANGKKSGAKSKTTRSKLAALTDDQVIAMLRDYDNGASLGVLAEKYDCSRQLASEIARGEKYRWVPEVNQPRIKPIDRWCGGGGPAVRITRTAA